VWWEHNLAIVAVVVLGGGLMIGFYRWGYLPLIIALVGLGAGLIAAFWWGWRARKGRGSKVQISARWDFMPESTMLPGWLFVAAVVSIVLPGWGLVEDFFHEPNHIKWLPFTFISPELLSRGPSIFKMTVTLILLFASLFVIMSQRYPARDKHWAYGTIGTLIGYWLKG
jgi:hypothetical protein